MITVPVSPYPVLYVDIPQLERWALRIPILNRCDNARDSELVLLEPVQMGSKGLIEDRPLNVFAYRYTVRVLFQIKPRFKMAHSWVGAYDASSKQFADEFNYQTVLRLQDQMVHAMDWIRKERADILDYMFASVRAQTEDSILINEQ